MELLRIEDLSFRYPKSEKNAVDGISLTVNEGEFIVVCGASGCGKTTLLRLLKRETAPVGEKNGTVYFGGAAQDGADSAVSPCDIGYVLQNPDEQIVTDKVWHELAFGLENMGVPQDAIRLRVGEMASYFGIQDWFRRKTDELSGGQKQLLNLASVMVMQPKLLILDEPTGQLDPIAAADFIATLRKLNRELGLTIILAEHRLEEVFPLADRVLVMENGLAIVYADPREVGTRLREIDPRHPMLSGLPSAVRIFGALHHGGTCPLTAREGRDFLNTHYAPDPSDIPLPAPEPTAEPTVELRQVWFRYERDLPDVLRGASLRAYAGELYCLLGGNGSGKTTTLNVISGLNRAYRGKVRICGKLIRDYRGNSLYRGCLAYLPQNPQTLFVRDTVRTDLAEIPESRGFSKKECAARVGDMAERVGITRLLDRHPYDLSGGEQQKCAIAKVLLSEPRVLLLDEPTKGLDAYSKRNLQALLSELRRDGLTLLMVTHDVEFAAENADRCALFFDGEVFAAASPGQFFSGNSFYTTVASRMARRIWRGAVTCDDVVSRCLSYDARSAQDGKEV